MLKHYCSLALRNIASAPLAAAINVSTLSVGLACFVTAFAFVAFWQRAEQHFENADRIAVLTLSMAVADGSFSFEGDTGTPDVAARYLAADFPAIERIARAVRLDDAMVSTGERAVRLRAVAVDPEFTEIFELPFVSGDAQTALRTPRSVVVAHDQAAQLFGTADPIGRNLVVGNAVEATVTGVVGPIPEPSHMGRSASAPLKFDMLFSRDVLDALAEAERSPERDPDAPQPPENWFSSSAVTYMLLPADGSLSVESLRAQLATFAARHVPEGFGAFATLGFGAVPVRDVLGSSVDGAIFISAGELTVAGLLLTLGTLVLAVACVNYANLATARAARRTREVGLRKALGARPTQIMAQHLLEAGVFASAALTIALVALRLFEPLLASISGADVVGVAFAGAGIWLFLGAVLLVVTLAAGAYPAFALARVRPVRALRTSRTQIGPRALSVLLVGSQFAVASFLLIAVTITILQNAQLKRTGLNTTSDPLLVIDNDAGAAGIETATLREELLRIPQVNGVTQIDNVPWESVGGTAVAPSPDENAPSRFVLNHQVGYDFFSVFDIEVLAGRVFGSEFFATDHPDSGRATPSGQPRAIVVDRAFAAEFGFASPAAAVDQLVYVPQRISNMFGGGFLAQPLRIVGVVENKVFSFFGPTGTKAGMYQLNLGLGVEVVRLAANDVAGALQRIDETWQRLAPNVAIRRRFLDDVFDAQYATFARISNIFGALAAMAFVISVTGLFGMATLVAGGRAREIGVRKVHGASTAQMIALLLASFSVPVITANVLVWLPAYLAARSYLGMLLAPIALTAWPFVFSLLVTLAIAWVSVGGQTLRAAGTRPAEVLRYE